MTTEDILRLRDLGEVSKVQFKERILDTYDTGCELAAMSNYRGGRLIVGINDKTLGRKLKSGKFNSNEMDKMIEVLDIKNPIEIFFCSN